MVQIDADDCTCPGSLSARRSVIQRIRHNGDFKPLWKNTFISSNRSQHILLQLKHWEHDSQLHLFSGRQGLLEASEYAVPLHRLQRSRRERLHRLRKHEPGSVEVSSCLPDGACCVVANVNNAYLLT